jgi:hypothetical protein
MKKRILPPWISHFDCGYDTGWHYIILDKPFDISAVKSKKRLQIKKGIRNFDVRIIDANIYAEQIYNVHVEAAKIYHGMGKWHINKNSYCSNVKKWQSIILGVFLKNTDKFVAWKRVRRNAAHIGAISHIVSVFAKHTAGCIFATRQTYIHAHVSSIRSGKYSGICRCSLLKNKYRINDGRNCEKAK